MAFFFILCQISQEFCYILLLAGHLGAEEHHQVFTSLSITVLVCCSNPHANKQPDDNLMMMCADDNHPNDSCPGNNNNMIVVVAAMCCAPFPFFSSFQLPIVLTT